MKCDHAATSFKEALNGSNERCLTSGVFFRRAVVGLPMTELDQDVVGGWITPRHRARFRRQLDLVRRNLDDAAAPTLQQTLDSLSNKTEDLPTSPADGPGRSTPLSRLPDRRNAFLEVQLQHHSCGVREGCHGRRVNQEIHALGPTINLHL